MFWKKKKQGLDEEKPRTINDFYLVELKNYHVPPSKSFAEFADMEQFLERISVEVMVFVYDGYLYQEYAEGVFSCQI